MGLMLDPAKAVAFYAISGPFFCVNNIPTTIKHVDLLCDCEFGLYVIVYE